MRWADDYLASYILARYSQIYVGVFGAIVLIMAIALGKKR